MQSSKAGSRTPSWILPLHGLLSAGIILTLLTLSPDIETVNLEIESSNAREDEGRCCSGADMRPSFVLVLVGDKP